MEMLDFQQDFPFKLTAVKYESKSGSIYIFPNQISYKAKKMDGNPNFHCGSLEDFREIFIFIFRSKSWTSTNTQMVIIKYHIYMVLFYIYNE